MAIVITQARFAAKGPQGVAAKPQDGLDAAGRFFRIFGALQLAVAVAGYALSYYNGWDWWAPSLLSRSLGAYDIWRGLKVRGPAQGMKAG